ncbi:MAG TPA: phosphatase PAP2 family protein [Candidatus Acidoferrales bacterium]|nr:phosphatase PAP2 family protein [Candidatus Acidoferrales bacterium]
MAPVRRTKFLGMAALAVAISIPLAIAIHAGVYDSFMDSALTGFGFWGSFAIYLSTRPGRKECVATVLLGTLLRFAYDLTIGERGYQGSALIGMGTFLGFASLAALALGSLREADERRAICRRSLVVVGILMYVGVCLSFYISFLRMALPWKYDHYLYCFDGSLGFQPSFAAGRLLLAFQPLNWIEAMIYNSLGFWFSLVYALHANTRAKYPLNVLKLLMANAGIGFLLYFMYPAMGPKFAFPSFPILPVVVRPAVVAMTGIPNAMPSLHFGGALLIFWSCRPWKWLRRITGAFAILTALATLGLGEHYLIDLIVAAPYALAIFALAAETPGRKQALMACPAMVAAWLVFLRIGIFHPAISWAFALTTLAAVFVLERRLAAQLWSPQGRNA